MTTIVDVARAAGVSTATVSRVLNNHPQVDPRLAANVLRVIKELGYRPSRVARTLRTRQNDRSVAASANQSAHFMAAPGPNMLRVYGIIRARKPKKNFSTSLLRCFHFFRRFPRHIHFDRQSASTKLPKEC